MKLRKRPRLIATATVAGVFVVAAGCGGTKSTASRSAEQYDAALAKGEPVKTEEGHGGHGGHAGDTQAAMDHSKMPGRAGEAPMAGMDHSKMAMPSSPPRTSGSGTKMDHSRMPGMAHGTAAGMPARGASAMDHSRMTESGAHAVPGVGQSHPAQPGASSATGHMDHSAMTGRPGGEAMPGMQHAPTTGGSSMLGMQHGTMTSPRPEPAARVAAPAEPARTLQPDPLDMPAPTAVEGATRAAAMATEMAGGHAMSHGTYRQLDAGRDPGPTAPTGMQPGHQMNETPMQAPTPGGGHQMHSAPASPSSAAPARPTTPRTPGQQRQPSRPQSQPSADPHLHHQPSASASPSPRPSPTPKESNE
jgi:hypothetical protein